MSNIAVFPGTFDPITLGHLDLIERGSRLFDELIIGVAADPHTHKKPVFDLAERETLILESLSGLSNVKVVAFQGLLAKFIEAQHANILLRGVRSVTDFDYEMQLSYLNQHLMPHVETVMLMPTTGKQFVSSSFVREVSRLGGSVDGMVPANVFVALKDKQVQ